MTYVDHRRFMSLLRYGMVSCTNIITGLLRYHFSSAGEMSVFYVDRFNSALEQVNLRLYISGLGVTGAQLLEPVLMKAAIAQLRHEMGTIHENALFIQTERGFRKIFVIKTITLIVFVTKHMNGNSVTEKANDKEKRLNKMTPIKIHINSLRTQS